MYYKKAKFYAILCAALVVVAAALVVGIGLPEKAPFSDSTVLTVKCVDIPLDYSKLDTELAAATDLPYTVVTGNEISGNFEAANVTFEGTDFNSVDAQTLVSTLGASYSVLSLNTITGKSTSGMTMFLIFTGVATLLVAGLYLAFRYGLKTALSAFVPAFAAVGGVLIVAVVIGAGFSYPLAVASVCSFAVALFFSAMAFGQAREMHESKHVHDHDDVANETGAVLMSRNIKIAAAAVIILGTVAVTGVLVNITDLTYTAIPLLIGTLIGLFGAQFCAVPLCMAWQDAEDATAAKKAHAKKPVKKTPAKTASKISAKSSAKKAPSKSKSKK
ncbi:MAG TPA: hypothetical protein PK629_04635 [Oscillospiraceae bacterium]|nr:hypothetical protein [Oscillospiraceae bacterium]HPF56529.1 hypothetical protein [Clostridiales bacterium]HPK34832.1 hypothetical protein [Oscillospiraceae bacterium]HPR76847.1 hypothetical protein [Oscillospiraceae bacterium]